MERQTDESNMPIAGHSVSSTRMLCYRKGNHAMRPIYYIDHTDALTEDFWESLAMPTATFPEVVNELMLRRSYESAHKI